LPIGSDGKGSEVMIVTGKYYRPGREPTTIQSIPCQCPESERMVEADARKSIPVGEKSHGGHSLIVTGQGQKFTPCLHIPDLDEVVIGSRGQKRSIRREGERPGFLRVSRELKARI